VNALTAPTLPWIGSPWSAQATGMPAVGLAIAVSGFAPLTQPLGSILPQGQPGCDLLASPDLLQLLLPNGGAAATSLVVPNSQALVGVVVHHQVLGVEFGAGGIVALTGTNRLTLTLGAF
jgi:hypothetical protein